MRSVDATAADLYRQALHGFQCNLGEVFRTLAEQKVSRILEGHLIPDRVNSLVANPPKFPVSQVIGFIKGKRATHLAQVSGERRHTFVDRSFRARGEVVSTVGRDESLIRQSTQDQEKEDQRLDQLNPWS